MRKERKHYSAEEKVAILRRHLLDKVPVSDLLTENAHRRACETNVFVSIPNFRKKRASVLTSVPRSLDNKRPPLGFGVEPTKELLML